MNYFLLGFSSNHVKGFQNSLTFFLDKALDIFSINSERSNCASEQKM